jgi:hypothetical protein
MWWASPAPPAAATPITLTITVPEWIASVWWALVGIETEHLYTGAAIACALLVSYLLWHPSVPAVTVPLHEDELPDALLKQTATPPAAPQPTSHISCHNPATGDYLGVEPAESEAGVASRVLRARAAQEVWATSSFATRRRLMRILSRCVLDHAETICRISARDSGKTTTDAAFGEVLVTLEKLQWLCSSGEACLKPERRPPGRMLFYKCARVEWHPRGVLGAIVPWNYPFHNIVQLLRSEPRDTLQHPRAPAQDAPHPTPELKRLTCDCLAVTFELRLNLETVPP